MNIAEDCSPNYSERTHLECHPSMHGGLAVHVAFADDEDDALVERLHDDELDEEERAKNYEDARRGQKLFRPDPDPDSDDGDGEAVSG